jgi:hypothetical protein
VNKAQPSRTAKALRSPSLRPSFSLPTITLISSLDTTSIYHISTFPVLHECPTHEGAEHENTQSDVFLGAFNGFLAGETRLRCRKASAFQSSWPLVNFIHIPITTPIVPALKNYCTGK